MVFAPLSEIVGRRPIYASTLLLAVIFTIPGAVAKNIATLLVTRAIAGIAFSAPMTLVGGTLADMWKTEERGVPMAAFSAAPFIGPAIGPLVSLTLKKKVFCMLIISNRSVAFSLMLRAGDGYTGYS